MHPARLRAAKTASGTTSGKPSEEERCGRSVQLIEPPIRTHTDLKEVFAGQVGQVSDPVYVKLRRW
jgi:hypothetical protein